MAIDDYAAMPGSDLVREIDWTRATVRRLQRELAFMLSARRHQRRKVAR